MSDRPRLELPSASVEDAHSIFVNHDGAGQASSDDYADIRNVRRGTGDRTSYWRPTSVDDPYHYIDIDRPTNQSASDGNQIVSPDDYQGLDPAVSPPRPHDYDRLARSSHAAAEHIEMSQFDGGNGTQHTVSTPL